MSVSVFLLPGETKTRSINFVELCHDIFIKSKL